MLDAIETHTAMRSSGGGEVAHDLPRVQFGVVLLDALQVRALGVGVAARHVDAAVDDGSATLHPPLLHRRHLPPLVPLGVVAVRDGGLTSHQEQLVVHGHRAQAILRMRTDG